MLDWLVVGGGPLGSYLARSLVAQGGCAPGRVRVLDPHPRPLARWRHCTGNTGMRYLRSPAPYHLDGDPMALSAFAWQHRERLDAPFLEPYRRPSLALFELHAQAVLAEHRVQDLWLQGTAVGLQRRQGHWAVACREGELRARRVLLAIGHDRLRWPAWAARMRALGAPVQHAFEAGFSRQALPQGERVLVVGGGLSGAQLATAIAQGRPGRALWLARKAPDLRVLDAEGGWSTPRLLKGFWAEGSMAKRRATIQEARPVGSMTPEAWAEAQAVLATGALGRLDAEVLAWAWAGHSGRVGAPSLALPPSAQGAPWASALGGAQRAPDGGGVALALSGPVTELAVDRIVLATGFGPGRPAPWLDAVAEAEGLPLAPCGFPVVDASLAWAPGLHLAGALGELELGPFARNLAGARLAAARILEVA